MNEELITDALVRKFLLGKLEENERNRIESLFLTDSQVKTRVLNSEQDLIEDYLEDSLTYEDKERFLARFAQTDEQRQKLRITKSIKDRALATPHVAQAPPDSVSLWTRLRNVELKPVFLIPITVGILIACLLGSVWLNSKMEQRKHLAVEQEIAQLNSPANLREVPSQIISLQLRPVTVRSAESPVEVTLSSGTRVVELRLPWIQSERYTTYRAEIRTPELYMIHNLQAESNGAIRLRLPAHILRRGQTQVRLTGINTDGNAGLTEEYTLAVG